MSKDSYAIGFPVTKPNPHTNAKNVLFGIRIWHTDKCSVTTMVVFKLSFSGKRRFSTQRPTPTVMAATAARTILKRERERRGTSTL